MVGYLFIFVEITYSDRDECGIQETMKGLLQVVDAIPRMEQFVGDVCNVVFCDGERLLPRCVIVLCFEPPPSADWLTHFQIFTKGAKLRKRR